MMTLVTFAEQLLSSKYWVYLVVLRLQTLWYSYSLQLHSKTLKA